MEIDEKIYLSYILSLVLVFNNDVFIYIDIATMRSLDVEQLRSEILTSPPCQADSWPSDVDEMATMYDSVRKSILD